MERQEELLEVTKVSRKEGEENQAFLSRVAKVANNLQDEDWRLLSETAQDWVNAANFASDHKQELPDFEDEDRIEELLDAIKKEEEEDNKAGPKKKGKAVQDEEEGETDVVTKSKKAAKANGKAPAKAAKKAAGSTAKKAGTKSAPQGEGRGRKGSFPLEAKITVKTKDNPHRTKSNDFEKFKKLKTGMTVGSAVDAGVDWGYLRYAVKRELVTVGK